MSKKEPIYTLNNVSKIFQDKNSRTVAVDDVSFEINKGEIFGIIGMSGAGKSTLVRTLNRLEEVSEGQVIFDGKELGKLNNKELRSTRKEIAMIFQGFNLLIASFYKSIKIIKELANIFLLINGWQIHRQCIEIRFSNNHSLNAFGCQNHLFTDIITFQSIVWK